MKGITTIAALPSGAGQAAALPAEVGEAKPEGVKGVKFPEGAVFTFLDFTQCFEPCENGEIVNLRPECSYSSLANFGKAPE